jgi:ACS family hexuronate transporter-like MFS transporter
MFVFAVCVIPVISAQALGKINPWFAILIIGLASACHQAWSANIFTTTSDMFPKKTIGSVTGLGGMAGSLGGILIFKFAGALFDHYIALHNIETGYYIMFFICGSMYLIAWLLFYVVLVPRMKPVEL